MILLDTHIFIWWIDDSEKLSEKCRDILRSNVSNGLGVSIISLWETVKLHERSRLNFDCSIDDWLEQSLQYQGIVLLNLDIKIILESSRLPGVFHRDPADQLIVATSRVLDIPLLTMDAKIIDYSHVKLINSGQ